MTSVSDATCKTCGDGLTGRQLKFCSPECRRKDEYARQLNKVKPDLHCKRCGKQLGGRQQMWCSLACKRDYDTEVTRQADQEALARKCRTCGLVKPLKTDFYLAPSGTYRRTCRACVVASNKERDSRPDAADKKRDYHLRSLYGLSAVEYEALLVAQGGKCAVCGRPPVKMRLAVDHDHRTLKIRGLLCNYCNLRVIGKMTNSEVLMAAASYLADPPAQQVLPDRAVPRNPPKKRRTRRKKKA